MNFGQAIEALKCGAKVKRKGWNGKNMFLWLKEGTLIREEWCKDPVLKKIAHDNGGTVEGLPTICMKTADNKVLTGWNASQTDMMANDWDYYIDVSEYFEHEEISDDFDWNNNIPEEERVSSEDLKNIIRDERFNDAIVSTENKMNSLLQEDIDANSVILSMKKEFKMGDEYEHAPKRTDKQDFEAKVQNIGTQVLRMHTREERLDYLKQAKEEILADADTEEKKLILENNFNLFEEYARNN